MMIFVDVLRCLLKHLFLKLLLIFQNNGPVRRKVFLVLKMQVKILEIATNPKLFSGFFFQHLINCKNALKYYLSHYSDLHKADSLLDDVFSFFENTAKISSKEMTFQDFIPKETNDVLCYLYEEPSSENSDREEPNEDCLSNENLKLILDNVKTITEHHSEQSNLKETDVLTKSEIADPAVKCASPQERKANGPDNIIKRRTSDDIECKINKNLECKGSEVIETHESDKKNKLIPTIVFANESDNFHKGLRCITPLNTASQQCDEGNKSNTDTYQGNKDSNINTVKSVSGTDVNEGILAEEIGNNCTLNPNMHYNLSSKCIKSEISSKDFPFSKMLSGMASRSKNESNSKSCGSNFIDNDCDDRPKASRVSDHIGNAICEDTIESNVKECHGESHEINQKFTGTLTEYDKLMLWQQAIEADADSLNRSTSIDEKLFSDESNSEHVSPKNSHVQETLDMQQICVSDMSRSTYCDRWVNEASDENTDLFMPDIYKDSHSPEGVFDNESSLQNTNFNVLERTPAISQNNRISQDGELYTHYQSVSNELNILIDKSESSKSKPWPYELPKDYKSDVKKDLRYQKRFYKLNREGKMDSVLKEYSDKKDVNSLTISEEPLGQESYESDMDESNECTNEEQFETLDVPAEEGAQSKMFDKISSVREKRRGFLPYNRPPLEMSIPKFTIESDGSVKTGYKSNSFLENSPETSESDNSQASIQDEISEMDAEGISHVKSLDKCYYTRVSFNYTFGHTKHTAICLRDRILEPSESGRHINLRPLFTILYKHCVTEEFSIEEQLDKLRKVEDLFYDMLFSNYENKEMYRDTIKCCEIPMKDFPDIDEDYELDGDDLVLSIQGMQEDEIAKTDMFQGTIINESEEIQSSSTDYHVSAEDTPVQISEEILKIERKTPENDKSFEDIQKESFNTSYTHKKFDSERVQRDELYVDLEKDQVKNQKCKYHDSSDNKTSDIKHETLYKIDNLDDKKNVENRMSDYRYETYQSARIPSKIPEMESESNVEDSEADNCNDFKVILESGCLKRKHPKYSDNGKSENSSELNEKDQFDLPLNADKCKSSSQCETFQNRNFSSKIPKMCKSNSENDESASGQISKVINFDKISDENIVSISVDDSTSSGNEATIS